eukprot:7183625-Prymnesium_polylepis.1
MGRPRRRTFPPCPVGCTGPGWRRARGRAGRAGAPLFKAAETHIHHTQSRGRGTCKARQKCGSRRPPSAADQP